MTRIAKRGDGTLSQAVPEKTILFDTGAKGDLLLANLEKLALRPSDIQAEGGSGTVESIEQAARVR